MIQEKKKQLSIVKYINCINYINFITFTCNDTANYFLAVYAFM